MISGWSKETCFFVDDIFAMKCLVFCVWIPLEVLFVLREDQHVDFGDLSGICHRDRLGHQGRLIEDYSILG